MDKKIFPQWCLIIWESTVTEKEKKKKKKKKERCLPSCKTKLKNNNQTEVCQTLNNMLNNLSAREKLHSAGFVIVIIKDDLCYKRKALQTVCEQ